MNFGISLIAVAALFSVSSLAQTELLIKKFRFRKHTSANFERLVLEFNGPSVQDEVDMKVSKMGTDKDVALGFKNIQLVGAIPESTINESLQNTRKFLGPLSLNTDMPKNGFSLRTLIKNPEAEVDAFWLAQPTRLVVDVYPKTSPRAGARNILDVKRGYASEKEGNKKSGKPSTKSPERIYCFPSMAKMGAAVAFAPWNGSSTVPLDVKDPASAQNEMKEGVVCYPAQSRLHPQVNFTTGEMEKAALNSEMTDQRRSSVVPEAKAALLPPIEKTEEARSIASEPSRSGQFAPTLQSNLPPSLGANFEKPQKGANPASLLPPFR